MCRIYRAQYQGSHPTSWTFAMLQDVVCVRKYDCWNFWHESYVANGDFSCESLASCRSLECIQFKAQWSNKTRYGSCCVFLLHPESLLTFSCVKLPILTFFLLPPQFMYHGICGFTLVSWIDTVLHSRWRSSLQVGGALALRLSHSQAYLCMQSASGCFRFLTSAPRAISEHALELCFARYRTRWIVYCWFCCREYELSEGGDRIY